MDCTYSLRVGPAYESLYFPNAKFLEDYVLSLVADAPEIEHLVLIMNAVNLVDMSAFETLESLIDQLRDAGVAMHLAEVKGPKMDQFQHGDLLCRLVLGNFFLSTHAGHEGFRARRRFLSGLASGPMPGVIIRRLFTSAHVRVRTTSRVASERAANKKTAANARRRRSACGL